jgi:hypothetical protein
MLKEISNPRQNTNERRRIFADEYFDLYVWFSDNDRISGFQLCYDKGDFERALTWTEQNGFSHMKVDDGEGFDTPYKMKPVLVVDGIFDSNLIAGRFRIESALLDKSITEFVLEKLDQINL